MINWNHLITNLTFTTVTYGTIYGTNTANKCAKMTTGFFLIVTGLNICNTTTPAVV